MLFRSMLISKWATMVSFVNDGNIILVAIICFGSASTAFYWTKWLGKMSGRSPGAESARRRCAWSTASDAGKPCSCGGPIVTIYVNPLRYISEYLLKNDCFTISFFEEKYRRELGVDVSDYSLWSGSAGARMAA